MKTVRHSLCKCNIKNHSIFDRILQSSSSYVGLLKIVHIHLDKGHYGKLGDNLSYSTCLLTFEWKGGPLIELESNRIERISNWFLSNFWKKPFESSFETWHSKQRTIKTNLENHTLLIDIGPWKFQESVCILLSYTKGVYQFLKGPKFFKKMRSSTWGQRLISALSTSIKNAVLLAFTSFCVEISQ